MKRLQAGEFIYEQPALGEAEYTFKHVLTQEVAYNSVLMERRRLLHERTGEVIEALFKERIDDHLADLAHHYSRSANTRKAVDYLFRAGRQATARSAFSEAVTRLSSALEFLKHLPDDAERARQELPMLSALGFSLGATKGYAAAELEPVYARARELCAQIHDPVHDFRALLGQWVIRWTKLELRDALQLADELMTAAEDVKDPAMLLYGTFARGTTLLLLGELVSGNEYLEKALAVFDLRQPLPGILELCRITSFGHLYSGLSWLGYPDRAWEISREMMEVAQRSADPFILANAANFAALHNLMRGDSSAAQKQAEEAMALVEEREFGSLSVLVTTWHGAALIAQAHYEEGIGEMRRGISAICVTGGRPYTWNFVLSGLRARRGRTARGRT